jgi:hypothetical protein
VEAVFVLVAFRRFAQRSGNQRERANSDDEKACGYDHDLNLRLPSGEVDRFQQVGILAKDS